MFVGDRKMQIVVDTDPVGHGVSDSSLGRWRHPYNQGVIAKGVIPPQLRQSAITQNSNASPSD